MIRVALAALIAALCGVSQTPSAEKGRLHDEKRFIGAWRLVFMAGPDGKPITSGMPAGMLIYAADGHMSVQLMYPSSEKFLSNEYVQNGYEASFGSYEIDPATHTLTHHVEGSNTRDRLVGRDLARVYRFDRDGRLTIRPARPDEHWSVTWERSLAHHVTKNPRERRGQMHTNCRLATAASSP